MNSMRRGAPELLAYSALAWECPVGATGGEQSLMSMKHFEERSRVVPNTGPPSQLPFSSEHHTAKFRHIRTPGAA
jgi:hypothetical protein